MWKLCMLGRICSRRRQACSTAHLSLRPWTSAYSRAAAGKLGEGTKAAASTLSCVDTRRHCTHHTMHASSSQSAAGLCMHNCTPATTAWAVLTTIRRLWCDRDSTAACAHSNEHGVFQSLCWLRATLGAQHLPLPCAAQR